MAATRETPSHTMTLACHGLARFLVLVFCSVMPNGCFVRCPQEGNLISIGPGMYPSNRTLDGGGRSILVLGSCEFMHNGTLSGLNYYVASSDWMILQIWRPVSLDAVSMMLVYERMIEPNTSVDNITQLRFDNEDLYVQEGDRIGFTKLNHTFPIPYIFNPQMSADLWYNRVPADISLPNISDVITFEEMGFPYHFSVTVTFKAQVSKNPPVVLRPSHSNTHQHKMSIYNDVAKPAGSSPLISEKAKESNKKMKSSLDDVMLGDAPIYDIGAASGRHSNTNKYSNKKVNSVIKSHESDMFAPLNEEDFDLDDVEQQKVSQKEAPSMQDVLDTSDLVDFNTGNNYNGVPSSSSALSNTSHRFDDGKAAAGFSSDGESETVEPTHFLLANHNHSYLLPNLTLDDMDELEESADADAYNANADITSKTTGKADIIFEDSTSRFIEKEDDSDNNDELTSSKNHHLIPSTVETKTPRFGEVDNSGVPKAAPASTIEPRFIFDTGMQTVTSHMLHESNTGEQVQQQNDQPNGVDVTHHDPTTAMPELDITTSLNDIAVSDITNEDVDITSEVSTDNVENVITSTDPWEETSTSQHSKTPGKEQQKEKGSPNDIRE